MSTSTTWQRTLVLIKPDGVRRGLMGVIIGRFEQAGLTITAMKMLPPDSKKSAAHYTVHHGKPFYDPLVKLLASGPVIALALEGAHAIEVVRKIVGDTEPRTAAPGTIRGDYCHIGYARSKERLGVIANLVHASDSPESATDELALWFTDDDFVPDYERTDARYF